MCRKVCSEDKNDCKQKKECGACGFENAQRIVDAGKTDNAAVGPEKKEAAYVGNKNNHRLHFHCEWTNTEQLEVVTDDVG